MSQWYKGKYDPSDFNVPPETKGGHSQKVQANIQSGHWRAIEEIIRSGIFPFGGVADFVRWAIREALLKIDPMEPQLINSTMKRANVINYNLQEGIARGKFEETISNLREVVRQLIGAGDVDMARHQVAYTYKQILAMPDEPKRELLWKVKYMNAVEKEFKEYLPADRQELNDEEAA